MRISYEWLKDYIQLDVTPEQLAADLSLFGHTVEKIESIGSDTVLDLEIHANRGDCLSVLGIAREVAALYNSKIKAQNSKLQLKTIDLNKNIKVEISDPKICPRFSARVIDNIEIKPSSRYIQKRLIAYGFRPINNIVDITNFVMVAVGQPLHAFDFDKIKAGQMNIGLSKAGEEIATLDSKKHQLSEGVIVIRDDAKIYDLAGIMGGASSEVDDKTKTIILQGAIFDSVLIRRASKKLAHITDASYRYERGVDVAETVRAIDMAATLIVELCPETQVGELVDIKSEEIKKTKITLDKIKVNNLLGIDITNGEMIEYLKRLNFKQISDNQFLVPSYRNFDVKIWQDLAEEISRVYGLDKIKERPLSTIELKKTTGDWRQREMIKDVLQNIGFSEIYSYSIIDQKQIELLNFKLENCEEIANPLSQETQFLRPILTPSLLTQIAKNPWAPEIAVFEIGKVFVKGKESWQLGLAVVGNSDQMLKAAQEKLSLKGDIQTIDQKVLQFYKIRRPVKIIIYPMEEINNIVAKDSIQPPAVQYRPVSKYPPTVRDLAFIVNEDVTANKVRKFIKTESDQILLVELFDEFTSEKFGGGKKNLAFHIWFEDLKKPILENDVNLMIKNIIKTVEEKFEAKLRS